MAATTEDPQATVGGFVNAIGGKARRRPRAAARDFVVYEAGGLPYSGEYYGPQGFFELFGTMNEAWT